MRIGSLFTGYGVVPQQAAAAISHLLERAEVYRNV